MDAILSYLTQNLLFTIVATVVVVYLASRRLAPAYGNVRKQDLVPAFKRFERRENCDGNRRQPSVFAFTGLERRLGLRRVTAL